ncbi:hypothetical protein, partial [Cellulosimicrobium cellulans]|uniref:hypothetical protein n=1 Tax=Cellulosimicrobium cellulans TaxID=1710 RepID=UPI001651D9AB
MLDDSPDTDPDPAGARPEGWFTTRVDPGTWWLHVRAGDATDRWGPTTHLEVVVVDAAVTVDWPAYAWVWEEVQVDVTCPDGTAGLRLATIDTDSQVVPVAAVHEADAGCAAAWEPAAEHDGERLWPDGSYELVVLDDHGAEASERVPAVVAMQSGVLERVLADYKAGLLTLAEVADLVLLLVSAPPSMPPRYVSGADTGGATTGDLLAVLDMLDPDVREAVLAALDFGHVEADDPDLATGRSAGAPANCARSSNPAFFPVKCTLVYADFTITYAAASVGLTGDSGVPERVAMVRDALNYARAAFRDMGFWLPQWSTDVYLVNSTVMLDGGGFSLPNRVIAMNITEDAGYYLPIHEYFHQVQYTYIGLLSHLSNVYWWMEATAEWASLRAQDLDTYPGSRRYNTYASDLGTFLKHDGSLNMLPSAQVGGPEYGAFVLAQYLYETRPNQEHDFDNPIHEVWKAIGATTTGTPPLEAIDQVLASRGTRYRSGIAEFRTWTYALHAQHGTGFAHRDARPGGFWRQQLGNGGATFRRVTDQRSVRRGAPASGTVSTAPSNAAYIELDLPSQRGLIRVQAQPSAAGTDDVDPETFQYAALPVAGYPSLCGGAQVLTRPRVGAGPGVDVLVDPPEGCTRLTLVITDTRKSGPSLRVDWSASWELRTPLSVTVDVAPGSVGSAVVENVSDLHVVG